MSNSLYPPFAIPPQKDMFSMPPDVLKSYPESVTGISGLGNQWMTNVDQIPLNQTSPDQINSGSGINLQGLKSIPFGSNPSLFGDANWFGSSTDGLYTPGKFDTLASYGGIAKDGFNLWNQFQAGKLAKENLNLQRDALSKNWAMTRATAQMGLENKDAQRLANTGLSGTAARTQAQASSLSSLAKYGL